MFDDQQQPAQPIDIKPPLIALACGGGGLLLSFGLCGAAAALNTGITTNRLSVLGSLGIGLFGLSLIVMLISFLWFVAVFVINAIRR